MFIMFNLELTVLVLLSIIFLSFIVYTSYQFYLLAKYSEEILDEEYSTIKQEEKQPNN